MTGVQTCALPISTIMIFMVIVHLSKRYYSTIFYKSKENINIDLIIRLIWDGVNHNKNGEGDMYIFEEGLSLFY